MSVQTNLAQHKQFIRRFTLWIYGVAMTAIIPLFKRKLLRRAKLEREYAEHMPERFGYYQTEKSEGWVWIHAVSLGETRAASIFISALRRSDPSLRFLLTHGTATGRREGANLLSTQDIQVWQAWDAPHAVSRFFQHFSPRVGIIMETEVWPQLCATAQTEGIPLVLANARLSERSLKRVQLLPSLMQPAFQSFTEIWAQTDSDALRLKNAGAINIQVVGNLKFDIRPEYALLARGMGFRQELKKAVVMFASSREGEEEMFLHALQQLHARTKNQAQIGSTEVQWLIVPRHPQRFAEVQQLCEDKGFSVSRRSQWDQSPRAADIWLGDSIGEMHMYYALAEVALLGGSFEKLGGQNLIEAIACDCPIVMGPYTYNFEQASQQAQAIGAALRAETMAQALEITLSLISTPVQLQAMRDIAKAWLQESSGATQRMSERAMLMLSRADRFTQHLDA